MNSNEQYMHRCLELATKGAGYVAPNPLVGALLVHEGRIIGEGFHQKYGEAHAEVNCIESVNPNDKFLIPNSTLYVSLEPCAHFGKTPPCAERIIKEGIQKVVIGCRDPFKEVNGKGIEKLMVAGIEVEQGILEQRCKDLNSRFFVYNLFHRPYIVLKWAATADGKIANTDYSRVLISNELSNRLVHKWRTEEAAILVGTRTAHFDDPHLTSRLWPGPNPVRLVVDMELRLPPMLHLFDQQIRTIVFNKIRHEERENLLYYQVTEDVELVHQVCNALYQLKIQSVLIEGGARLLQSFIDSGYWDEARVITNETLVIKSGIPAPQLNGGKFAKQMKLANDRIVFFKND